MSLQDYPIDYIDPDKPVRVTITVFNQVQDALRRYRKGSVKFHTKKEISEKLGVSYDTVLRVDKVKSYPQYRKLRRKK